MTIGSCRVVAIEGSHAAGKTTLVHALVARYRALGALITCTGEPARTSPYIEDIVRHDRGEFDLDCEVDLFAAQLTEQLRAARHHDLLICDKTVMNVLAYARLVLDTRDEWVAGVLDAIECFCNAWAPAIYDLVVHCADTYSQPNDTLRAKVADLQDPIVKAVLDVCRSTGCTVVEMPTGLTVDERVTWTTQHIDRLLNTS